jgi:hypothetical protein
MQSEIEDRARWLLGREPTRSMSASRLRERLVEELGPAVAAGPHLLGVLARAEGFLLLDAPLALHETMQGEPWCDAYTDALRAAMADPDIRLVLAEDPRDRAGVPPVAADARGVLGLVTQSVVDLATTAGRDASLRQALNRALTAVDLMERTLASAPGVVTTEPAEADRSTIRLPDPP